MSDYKLRDPRYVMYERMEIDMGYALRIFLAFIVPMVAFGISAVEQKPQWAGIFLYFVIVGGIWLWDHSVMLDRIMDLENRNDVQRHTINSMAELIGQLEVRPKLEGQLPERGYGDALSEQIERLEQLTRRQAG